MNRRIFTAVCAAASLAACQKNSPPKEMKAPIAVKRIAPVATVVPPTAVASNEQPISLAVEHQDPTPIDHVARANDLRDHGDMDGGLMEARRALYDDLSNTGLLEQIAHDAHVLGQREIEAEAFGQLAVLEPDDAVPLIREARVRIDMKDYAQAVRVAGEAVDRDEGDPESFQALGRAYLGTGNLSQAIIAFKKAVTLEPEHGYALNNLGFAYLRANRNEDAVQVLSEASELLPNIAYVQNNLGVALERTGRKDDAKTAYLKAMDLSPKYVKARINIDRIKQVASAKPIQLDDDQDTGVPADDGVDNTDAPSIE